VLFSKSSLNASYITQEGGWNSGRADLSQRKILLCPRGRTHPRTNGNKWSLLNLLKFREGKYRGEHGGGQLELEAKRVSFCSSGVFKTYHNLREGGKKEIPIQ
jgi:hypothetical protein